jgi:hypothetical protein
MLAILTKYHGPTNTRRARISATNANGARVFVPYDDAARNPHHAAALALCAKLTLSGDLVHGSTRNGYAYVFASIPFHGSRSTGGARIID